MSGKIRNGLLHIAFLMVLLLSAGCGLLEPSQPPAVSRQSFIPLPPPEGNFTTAYNYIGFGQKAQLQRLISSSFSDEYSENGSGVGKITSEKITLLPDNVSAITNRVKWGDWEGGTVTKSAYNDRNGKLLGGMLELEVEGSLLPLFLGKGRYVVDRSVISLVYARQEDSGQPLLRQVKYQEYWGPGTDKVAMGASVTWNDVSTMSEYRQWAFWEAGQNPFALATQALDKARAVYKSAPPDLVAYDEDSYLEFLGRQTGLHLYEKGTPVGTINLEYSNLFGPQPNTSGIGAGALSRVDWVVKDKTYTLLVLAPKFDRQKTCLYVWLDDPSLADTYMGMSWPTLYPVLRQNPAGVLLSVYAIGDVKNETASGSGSVKTDEGSKSVSVNVTIGRQGGLQWVVLGDPDYQDVLTVHRLMNLGGEGFMNSVGWGFPYAEGSGSGINFYLSLLRILLSPQPLTAFGQDVGLINRVGFAELP
jgi:hypothetical protein